MQAQQYKLKKNYFKRSHAKAQRRKGVVCNIIVILSRFLFCLATCTAMICASGCGGASKASYRVLLEEGAILPAITALAWPDAGSPLDCFAFAADDGFIRVVDVFSGRPLAVFSAGEEKISSLTFNSGGTELLSLSESGKSVTYPLPENRANAGGEVRPVGDAKSFSLVDGAVCMTNSATGKEIARYYFFSHSDEWACITPEGFYNASNGGAALIALEAGKRRYRLDRLSGALYRPDLFASLIKKEIITELPFTLPDLFKENKLPPLVSLSFEESSSELRIKITEQKGGAGYVALYRRAGEAEFPLEIPSGLFDVKNETVKKYSEKGKTCYEINVNTNNVSSEIGVSAFNESYTVESERFWLKLPSTRVSPPAANEAPVLRALVASGGGYPESSEELAELFSLQREGDLFSDVEVVKLFGEGFSGADFLRACTRLCSQTKKDDVLVVCLRGAGYADTLGNLGIVTGKNGENENPITGEEILSSLLNFSSNSLLLLLDLNSDLPYAKMETALQRFAGRLGPKALATSFGPSGNAGSLFGFFAEGLKPALAEAVPGKKYLYAEEILTHAAKSALEAAGQGSLVFLPADDFRIIDPFINAGELKFQAMNSGMLRIDQVDKTPVPLAFGDTMIRILPPGSYIIDLTYRNGYKETRTVELRRKESRWVVFTYTVPYLAGDFSALYSGRLPLGGINISELNPASYQKVNREAMEGMGMAPYYVAFLGGEKFYRDGDYDKAIAEYNRCISLKNDYGEAYASRGNAYRRKGDLNRAIEDYNRAINLKSSYAEVYNYRGFLYAQRRDYRRAIEDYTQAIRYKGDYADAYFNRAHAYGELGNWDLSIADYTQVIRLEPKNWAAYNQRGKAWNSKGDRVRAEADFANAERLKSP